MADIVLNVQAPVGGISRRSAYQTQPPFTSYDSENYWPIDVKTGRITTAIRPPLKLFGTLETEVNLLSRIDGIATGLPAQSFCASYAGVLYYWNGSTLVASGGAQAGSIDFGKYVSATAIVNQLVITKTAAYPIVFDYPTQSAATLVPSVGTPPTGATIAVTWQGALWLAKDSILYASRVGDITDWDVSVLLDDLYGSFFTDGDYRGVLAGPITAVLTQNADTMLVSTLSGTLAMRGHPRQGGIFEPVGNNYALGQGAWCLLPDSTILMLTSVGLMSLAPQPGAVMSPVSRERIPDELIGITYDRDDPLVSMLYDARWNGVHIYIRGAQEQAWWFDMSTGGFHRMSVPSYPFAIMEFPPFITESTSGILLGQYNGMYSYDRFADETINASLIVGPVKISQDVHHASKIQSVRVTFARDTPTGDGTFSVAAGIDGQDAVARMLKGEEQYSISMSALESNYGMCYPDVAGHAAVFSFSTASGDLAIEEISARITKMGPRLSMNRTTQIAVTGEASEFTGAFVDLDDSIWKGYSVATPGSGPDASLPDYTHFLDLSKMPTSWWDEVTGANGEDIRVSDAFNTQAPSMLIDFSLSGKTGMLAFKMTMPTTPKAVRVWVGNPDATTPSATATYGSNNVYDTFWRSFWTNAGGDSNVTQYGDNTETSNQKAGVVGTLAYGNKTGPMGAKATDFDFGDNTYWELLSWLGSQSLTAQTAWTFVVYGNRDNTTGSGTRSVFRLFAAAGFRWHELSAGLSGTNALSVMNSDDGTGETATSSAGSAAVANWRQYAGTLADDDNRAAFIDGQGKVAQNGNFTASLSHLQIGSDFNTSWWPGDLAMVQIHTIERPDAWLKYQADMQDQVTFWGSVGAFTLVNTIVPPGLDTTACPVGEVPQTETGTTDGYALLTPSDPTDGSVVNFSMMIDLAQLPAAWWTQAVASGKSGLDIRATDVNNTIIPFDLIAFDGTASTGLGVIKKTQGEGAPSAIRLWTGNATAITIDPCNAYGQYSSYDSDWRGFWPSGSGGDRTMYLNTLTSTGSPSVVSLGSPVDFDSTDYTNPGGVTNQYATATNKLPTGNPVTFTVSAKRPAGEINQDSVLVGIQDADGRSAIMAHTLPSSTPVRLSTRNPAGITGIGGSSTAITPTSWWFQAGTSFGNSTRIAYANNSGSSSSNSFAVVAENLDTVVIAAEIGSPYIRGFNGEISLVGMHTAARGTAWLRYWYASLDQATFWTVGAWVASPTSLS